MRKKRVTGRRDFLKMTAAGAAGMALTSGVGVENIFAKPLSAAGKSPLNKWPGRVVVNFNKSAVSSLNPVPAAIAQMVNESIVRLTDQADVGAAWKAVFPDTLSTASKIAVKVNTLNSDKPAPPWTSVRAMVDGLLLMDCGGTTFPAANITIYDMNNGLPSANRLAEAGYKPENFPTGVQIVTDTAADHGDGALSSRKYATSLKNADFLINVFGARGHNQPPAGSRFSLGFKSHYGTYADPESIHGNVPLNIREMVCTGPVFNKLVLSVCAGIFGTDEGAGPEAPAVSFKKYAQQIDESSNTQCPTTIIMSTDPVSAEMQAIRILRMNKDGAFGVSDMPAYLQASAGIEKEGFTPTYDIGIIDETAMDIRRIINSAVRDPIFSARNSSCPMVSAFQIKGHNTFIDFALPKDHFGKDAVLDIFDMKGARIRSFTQKVMGVRNSLSWDERDVRGRVVSKGIYVIRLSSGAARRSSQFSIVR